MTALPTALVRCCREWVVLLWSPVGRCGFCNTRPVYVPIPSQEKPS